MLAQYESGPGAPERKPILAPTAASIPLRCRNGRRTADLEPIRRVYVLDLSLKIAIRGNSHGRTMGGPNHDAVGALTGYCRVASAQEGYYQ